MKSFIHIKFSKINEKNKGTQYTIIIYNLYSVRFPLLYNLIPTVLYCDIDKWNIIMQNKFQISLVEIDSIFY